MWSLSRIALPSGWVTFAFTDIVGSSRLAQLLGQSYWPMLRDHRRLIRRAVRHHDGVTLFAEGDSCFLVFPDAGAALLACRSVQGALEAHSWAYRWRPHVRIGLHSGWATPRRGEYATPLVHRAARITALARAGQVLCSATTASSAKPVPPSLALTDAGLHSLRGFDGPEHLFRLQDPPSRGPAIVAACRTPTRGHATRSSTRSTRAASPIPTATA
jgi:class 3 adenylate cyclase